MKNLRLKWGWKFIEPYVKEALTQKKGIFELKFSFTMSFFKAGLDYMDKAGSTFNHGGGFRNPGLQEKGIFGLKFLFTISIKQDWTTWTRQVDLGAQYWTTYRKK